MTDENRPKTPTSPILPNATQIEANRKNADNLFLIEALKTPIESRTAA